MADTQTLDVIGESEPLPSHFTNEWLSIEQAALSLGVSVRTVNRRMKADELESRVDSSGRRQVLICRPLQGDLADNDRMRQTSDGRQDLEEDTRLTAPDPQMAQLAERASEAIRITISASRADAQQARGRARVAWACVGLMGAGLLGIVGLAAWHVGQLGAKADAMAERLAAQGHQTLSAVRERDGLRTQLETEQQARSRIEGELSARKAIEAKEDAAKQPALPWASTDLGQ